jgi:hypothetical protein
VHVRLDCYRLAAAACCSRCCVSVLVDCSAQVLTVNASSLAVAANCRYILGKPSQQRLALLQHLFTSITGSSSSSEQQATAAQIIGRFRAGSHPDVRAGRLSAAQVQRDTLEALRSLAGSASVSFDAFVLFHSALAAFADDSEYASTVAACWAAPRPPSAGAALCAPLMSGANSHALDRIRFTVLSRGVRGIAGLQVAAHIYFYEYLLQ